ncbi:TetR/AcrR family transcriptional regulator [Candidatus Babeliales bacterium]|nr:TetR/AcrR family transcriptional regulator [Candidatus Babeliales bacterium]
MAIRKKRIYDSTSREAQAAQTRQRILGVAQKLFQAEGFECVTIEKLAHEADVSAPTIYALFKSKRGIVQALMEQAMPAEQHEALVVKAYAEKSVHKRLALAAKIARQMYDAERAHMAIFRGAAALAPELKKLEVALEKRRYKRLEKTIEIMVAEKSIMRGLSAEKAHDILWAFTGRDMYRMLVVERGWGSGEYEKWLAQVLLKVLVGD